MSNKEHTFRIFGFCMLAAAMSAIAVGGGAPGWLPAATLAAAAMWKLLQGWEE